MTDRAPHPRIKCAACNASLMIVPSSLIDTICCSECGEEIPVEAYANLSRLKAQVIAEHQAAAQRKARAEATARQARRQAVEEARREERDAGEKKKAERKAEKERRRSEKLEEHQQSAEFERKMKDRGQKAKMRRSRAVGSIGWFAANAFIAAGTVLLGLGLILLLIGICEKDRGLGRAVDLSAATTSLSTGLSIFLIGAFWHSLLYAAEAIVEKLQLILDRLPGAMNGNPSDKSKINPLQTIEMLEHKEGRP